ncbi:MAG: DUF4410 domain-containing protein [Epsilonproteobacteria bacterium]|nr:DUF4410 domain-containing protein [Campylobacterota bacterium]
MRKNLMSAIFIAILSIGFAGCSSSSTTILQPNSNLGKVKYSSYNIQEVIIANNVPFEQREYFKTKLDGLIFKQFANKGNDLSIKYSFITYNEGNQFARYMLGGIGGAGKGELVVKAEFFDLSNQKIGEIQSKGEIAVGLFGGSFKGTLDKVAEEISNYTVQNYLK